MDKWPYLAQEDFHIRQHIAAYYMRDLSRVVEIGPHLSPVKPHLADGVEYIPVSKGEQITPVAPYGLVALGLGLEGGLEYVAGLAQRAQVVVLEWATEYKPGAEQAERIMRGLEQLKVLTMSIPKSGGEYAHRTLVALRGA